MNIQQTLADHTAWLADYKTGKRADLRGADLRGANLRGADLRNADLQSADLRYANLQNADLRSANLQSVNLRYTDLRHTNLRHTDLRYADLRYTPLRGADLRYADLRYADLRYADLRYADLRYADFGGAIVRIADTDLTINQDMSNFHLLRGSKHWGYRVDGYIKIGCEEHTVTEWLANVVKIAKEASYTKEEQQEYKALIKTASEVF